MKVIALNGSPNERGNTWRALRQVADVLEKHGIEVEIAHIGGHVIRGCNACNKCVENKDERCIFADDPVNEYIQKIRDADGLLIGSPVHFSGISATLKAFLDRVFYTAAVNDRMFRQKVGAAVVVLRRSGGLTVFNQLNNYLLYTEFLVPSSNYFNVAFGKEPGDVERDIEGQQILQILGENMAWALKIRENTKDEISPPDYKKKQYFNYIR